MREYIDSFLKYLVVEKGFSKNTEEAYRNDLCQLENFMQKKLPPSAVRCHPGMVSTARKC